MVKEDSDAGTIAPLLDADDSPQGFRPRPLTRLPRLPTAAFLPNSPPPRPRVSSLEEKLPRLPTSALEPLPKVQAAPRIAVPPPKMEPAVFEIQQWVLALARAFGGLRVYAANNARLREYFQTAATGLNKILESRKRLTLDVVKNEILVKGTPVRIDTNDNARTLVRRLTVCGVDCLVFKKGVDVRELQSLLSALASDGFNRDAKEETPLEGLIKSGAIPHILFSHDETAASIAAMALPAPKSPAGPAAVLTDHLGSSADPLFELGRALGERSLPPPEDGDPYALARERVKLGNIEAETRGLDRRRQSKDLASRSARILFAAVVEGREPLDSSPTLALFLRLYDALFGAGEYGVLASFVEGARAMSDGADRQTHARGMRILEYLVDPPQIDRLIRALNERREVALQIEFATLVDALVPFAAQHLLEQLDALEYPEHAEWICEVVARTIEVEPALLEDVAPKLGPKGLRALLGVGLRQPEAVSPKVVVDALEHTDPEVRCAAVQLLGVFPKGDADTWLGALLGDPDATVRGQAEQVLARRDPSLGLTQDAAVPETTDDQPITQVTAQMSAAEQREALDDERTVDEAALERRDTPISLSRVDAGTFDLDDVKTLPAAPAILPADTEIGAPMIMDPDDPRPPKNTRKRKRRT